MFVESPFLLGSQTQSCWHHKPDWWFIKLVFINIHKFNPSIATEIGFRRVGGGQFNIIFIAPQNFPSSTLKFLFYQTFMLKIPIEKVYTWNKNNMCAFTIQYFLLKKTWKEKEF